MEVSSVALYILASLLLLLSHAVRAARWALLFRAKEIQRRFDLLLGLALGYAVNAIIPWRIGEVVRTWFASAKTTVRFSYVASTVAAERLTDLIVVSIIASFVAVDADTGIWPIPAVSIGLAAAIVVLAFLIRHSQRVRRAVWVCASIFNHPIKLGIADFFWSLSELVIGGALLRPRFLATTLVMWLGYMASYQAFAIAAGQGLSETVFAMLGSPLRPAIGHILQGDPQAAMPLLWFSGFPVLGILIYGGLKQFPATLKLLNARRRYGWYASRASVSNTRNRFQAEREYEIFLGSLFSGEDRTTSSFGLDAIDDGTIHKLFVGGSDAITAVVEVDGHLLIRKFAVGDSGIKLKGQHDWLKSHRCDAIPFVDVLRERQNSDSYYYDMPLVVPSNDFYDFIHTQSIEGSCRIFLEVIRRISDFHREHRGPDAEPELVRRYVEEKGVRNARVVLDFARGLFPGSEVSINGRPFDFEHWNRLLDADWLARQVRRRESSVVHGDLTIENIIVAPHRALDWYIIDPNPENIFNTPLIDWSKLMQSVNLGYEGLNRHFHCVIAEDSIQLSFTKSLAYSQLHSQLEQAAVDLHGEDGLREIYFHELINYLRLTPYKIRQNPNKAVCFFACTSLLLERYLEVAI